ncbi:MAG: 3-dehydroquinate synthase [Thermoanaerobaculia bacterium]
MATSPLITVRQASGDYPVFVGRGLASRVGELVTPRGRVFVLTSPELRSLWGDRVAQSFSPHAEVLTVEEGEVRKTLATANDVVSQLLVRDGKRDSLLVVVGGGMLGDTGGFAASVFLRGIDVVQVPTTLLAQVDSSIGGKTGVNHELGKNLIGTFHVPRAVVADPACLETLPQRELAGGLFEALKAGVVGDIDLFRVFEERPGELLARDPAVLDDVVARAVRVKASIVSEDEREGGLRRLLNYGHTIGHALETVLRYEQISHGEAVGWGMVAANAIAVRRHLLPESEAVRIDGAIASLGPTPLPPLDREAVLAATGFDKKNTSRGRVMVLPRAVGDAVIVEDISDDEIGYGVDALL